MYISKEIPFVLSHVCFFIRQPRSEGLSQVDMLNCVTLYFTDHVFRVRTGSCSFQNCRLLINWPEQTSVLHSCVSSASPWQSAPPCAGAGLLQVRALVWFPPPHSAEHDVHSPKSPHLPSTGSNYNVIIVLYIIHDSSQHGKHTLSADGLF